MQALVARELVEGFGLPERQTAVLLGIVPSSVSQYLSGKRLGPTLSTYLGDEEARRIARQTAQKLMTGSVSTRVVLEAAITLGERFGTRPPEGKGTKNDGLRPELQQKVPEWLRDRIPRRAERSRRVHATRPTFARRAHPGALPADRFR